ncbi:polysaccharide pyruvyl transferase family protein [Jannaschia seohaensis]|uniref:Polysaccharide pyruvyl transferase WcaK-like protein n=1 Tax=Jannaschia seohaensis TaxID=475081 RepID=A0A2Y9A1N8_9RHOB|nr:polysaccharide pyruvyl transferase family protein [Jannaschia seohaensis]PWJ22183.1 polysaccharide pyruvyl transferase WcaK-like protein [Jannaschia seohaensis]SSA38461.1 Polysaccharide pyruvyl transferase family protein WcaK [Jannaschia seohaensis]
MDTAPAPLRVTQFGLCFSPNLGDGVIAECLAHGLRSRHPGVEVTHIDLSGREGFGHVTVRGRRLLIAILDRLPRAVRQPLAERKLQSMVDRVAAQWHAAARADLVVIGGGQVLSDANLNFPVKVGRAARMIAEAGTPLALYAVGASRNWTPRGRDWFRELLACDLRLVGPRDIASAEAWTAQAGGGPAPEVIADPGLLAADCYGPVAAKVGVVGLCVTDFGLLEHHADGAVAGAGSGVRFYEAVARALIASGRNVRLFTNGAAEDRAARVRVVAALADVADRLELPPDAERPAELVAQIAGCEAVVAHRLHACIVAYSYGRAVIGLGWDRKLQSFFEMTGRPDGFIAEGATPARIVEMLEAALAAERDPRQDGMIARAWAGIDRLLACVSVPAK